MKDAPPIPDHAAALEREFDWLEALIDHAIQSHFNPGDPAGPSPEAPDHPPDRSALGATVAALNLGKAERAMLALALAPNLRPHALDPFLVRNPNLNARFTEFGGDMDPSGGFLPTFASTAMLLSGVSVAGRLALERHLLDDGPLFAANLLERPSDTVGILNAPLRPTPHALARLCHGRGYRPDRSPDFPAARLTTPLVWDDLVLPRATLAEVDEILAWIRHAGDLYADPQLGRFLRPGYRSLFTGPSGTGKTLTATLLGKAAGRDVYRVDLSQVVSKWIGETEKNLAALFDRAEGSGWILFFDEADALFGKRTAVTQAHDRYANQEVSYILQRVEDFGGLAILASNLAGNIDEAFSRRFQSIVPFPVPGTAERLRLWRMILPGADRCGADVDAEALARRYQLTGGAIVNVMMTAALAALREDGRPIALADIEAGVARECWKEGRVPDRRGNGEGAT